MSSSQTIYVQLGRNGDEVNLLPILKDDANKGQRPAVMVCKEYSPLFSGCSFADAIEFNGSMWELDKAMLQAKKLSSDVKCCQVLGETNVVFRNTYQPAGQQHAKTDSFQKEVYQVLGRMDLWRKQPKPVFDKRDHKREQALIQSLPVNPNGAILVMAKGASSPFKADELLFDLLETRFGKGNGCQQPRDIIDLSTIKAEQFYDLLGIFEVAHCLVTVDTAHLHLAWACNVPVVAFIADKPSLWHGSVWRPNHIAHVRYGDFAARALEVMRAIQNLRGPGCPFYAATKKPRIFHVWSGYELTEENRQRHEVARNTWELEYLSEHWVSSPHEAGSVGRDSKTEQAIKDKERWPFLKEVIRTAALRAEDDDIICLTRADTGFTDGITEELLKAPCYAHRSLWQASENLVLNWHPMADLFAFTKKWWREHQAECPELVLRNDHWWNRTFLALMKKYGAKELPFAVYRAPSDVRANGEARPSELHNEDCHKEWQDKNGPIEFFPAVSKQLPTVLVNRHALSPSGYNGSIIRWNNRLLLAYRWHDQNNYSTALAIADIDEAGNVKSNKLINVPQIGGSEEDSRLFTVGKELFMSYVDSNYPSMPPKCVTRYGRLTEDTQWVLQDIQQPIYGDNHGNAMVKNVLMFEWENRLLCIWEISTETILLEIRGSAAIEIARFGGPRWPYGPIRGGTAPLPHRGKLLRFFHSGLDNEAPPFRRRYYCGALLTEPEPPFKILSVSREPVLRGSETDDLSPTERSGILHYKPKVVFPMGALPHKGGFLLSVGINDSHCGLIRVEPEKLHL